MFLICLRVCFCVFGVRPAKWLSAVSGERLGAAALWPGRPLKMGVREDFELLLLGPESSPLGGSGKKGTIRGFQEHLVRAPSMTTDTRVCRC